MKSHLLAYRQALSDRLGRRQAALPIRGRSTAEAAVHFNFPEAPIGHSAHQLAEPIHVGGFDHDRTT
jgi:hypothetical protein